jgi:hypothetical protein
MREGKSEWGCGELEMSGGGAIVASACVVGTESTACAWVMHMGSWEGQC